MNGDAMAAYGLHQETSAERRRGQLWRWSSRGILALSVITVVAAIAVEFRPRDAAEVKVEASAAAAAVRAGAALLVAAAAVACGALLGFLFGIPRFKGRPRGTAAQPAANEPGAPNDRSYDPNTNLEEVSDWLTKIILGASLVQIREILTWFSGLAHWTASLFLTRADSGVLGDLASTAAGAVLLTYFWAAFLLSYLFTSVDLPGMLESAQSDFEEEMARRLKSLPKDARREAQSLITSRMTEVSVAETERRRLETEVIALLYDEEHQGYRKAIDLVERYLRQPGRSESAALYAWLACAYGQMHRAVRKGLKPEESVVAPALRVPRLAALRAVRRAVEMDPQYWGDILRQALLNAQGDDDLHDFERDPCFRHYLLGEPKPEAGCEE